MSADDVAPEAGQVNPAGTESAVFRCPFCDCAYDHEWLTRVHITRTNDRDHQNHDGLMPETPVELGTDSGASQRITRHPDEIDVHALEAADLPDQLSETHKRIVVVACHHPYADSYTELHDHVQSVFEQRDLGSVSYQTVRRVVRDFFDNPPDAEQPTASVQQRYANLTEKQRQVIDAYLDDPSASYADLAAAADSSRSYPPQILDRFDTLIEELQAQQDTEGPDPVPSESTTPAAATDDAPEQPPAVTAGDRDSSEEPVDGPVTTAAKVLTASPYDEPVEEMSGDGTAVQSADPDTDDMAADPDTDSLSDPTETEQAAASMRQPASQAAESAAGETVSEGTMDTATRDQRLREQVAQLKAHVEFLRRIAERQTHDDSTPVSSQLALAKEIETELDRILQAAED